jgi:hypothetical protein
MKQHTGDSNSTQSDRLATIWAIVEARKTFPAMIVVAAATAADDTGAIACGLAEAANAAGKGAGLLRLTKETRGGFASGAYAQLSIDSRGSERDAFDKALEVWRTQFDVVIVDIADARLGALGAHVVSVADGVVVGLCAQRRVVAADRELAALLTQLQSSVIGVVLCAPMAKTPPARFSPDHSRLAPAAQR